MVFDLDLIKKVYNELPGKVAAARQLAGKPLTMTEKILYSHLHGPLPSQAFTRGKDYVDFSPGQGSYAGCYCPDGPVTVYDLWQGYR